MERAFVDEVKIKVEAGAGGDGCATFAREKFRPKGPPDGGDGGDGGSVILRVDRNTATLADLARKPHQRAESGGPGTGRTRHGATGEDRIVLVPDGTSVFDENGVLLADLVGTGSEYVVARGGRRGRGNASLGGRGRNAIAFAEKGEPGEARIVALELKVLADVGLVGFPNAGKSSLTSKLSAARPKIASYPFTTLSPNLGVTETADGRFVVADVPGLIEGASEGKGLGLAFLRHLERCRALCFVLDLGDEIAPAAALAALRNELRTHLASFDQRPGVIAANKIDLDGTDAALDEARAAAKEAGFDFVAVSAVSGEGIEELASTLAAAVVRASEVSSERTHRLIELRPEREEVLVERDESGGWRITHPASERLVSRFDLSNPHALAHVQDRLASYGVEVALAKAGAKSGDEVWIAGRSLEYTPDDEVDAP